MKKQLRYIPLIIGTFFIASQSCNKKLDLLPVSSISDASYWVTPEQFDAFVSGVHSRLRSHVANLQALGEMRADIFGTDPGSANTFTGEATEGRENMWLQTLTLDAPGVSNFGNFYNSIVQLNVLIEKLNNSTVVTPANKNYYLGIAYGIRAFCYFQITRAWGDAVIITDAVNSIDVSNLAKEASPEAQVIDLIKEDIEKSISSYGSDYSFRNTKSYWSKSATLMLKAEVYLWTAHRTTGTADATTALTALQDIQTNVPALNLAANFAQVFAYNNKGNNEMIFASRFLLNEATLPLTNFFPQTAFIARYYDSVGNRQFNVTDDNWGGTLRAGVHIATFRQFNDLDSRKWASIQAAYSMPNPGVYAIAGCFAKKFSGENNQGVRSFTNDYPIYRYADLLLLSAEAKLLLGQDPSTEINLVRARAFGTNYSATVYGYPNQPIDADPKQAILQERLFEFLFEGKRWLDLRRFGDTYVFQHTLVKSSEAYKVLWPVDRNSLTNNRALKQTPGYPAF